MTLELDEVREFLAKEPPFADLPTEALDTLPAKMDMIYAKRGTAVISSGARNDYLHIIRSGAVDVHDPQGGLQDRRGAGEAFGFSTLHGDPHSAYVITAVEDCLLLRLHREHFQELAARFPGVDYHFSELSRRIRVAAERHKDRATTDALRTQARDFMDSSPVVVGPEASIRQAAQAMDAANRSALFVVAGERLVGIVTDRDLRRMVAGDQHPDAPVTELMSPSPVSIEPETFAFETMLVMAERGIHHLPVVHRAQLVGVVSSANIVNLLRHNPLYLTSELAGMRRPEYMRATFQAAADMATRLVERGAAAREITGLLTVAADAVARRLLTLAEEELGAPPVPYCFVVVGSQGRRGMGLASDQDNCLVLSDDYRPEHTEYFDRLSDFVCSGLDTAGQVYCPGNMMASNPAWRKTRTEWIETFHRWATAPEPEALLHAQTFFDFRGIHGDLALAKEVHRAAVARAQRAPRLLAHLAALAARREPPLSFFRGFVVERSGEYAHTLDVKKGGLAAVVQMARLYALASGKTEVGTEQRLATAAVESVSVTGAENLSDAFEFLQHIALRWQVQQLRRGERPSYHIDPQALSKSDRERLRDAFHILKNMQTALATAFPVRNV